MYIVFSIFVYVVVVQAGPIDNTTTTEVPQNVTSTTFNPVTPQPQISRRIILGQRAGDTRPYMVYLRAAAGAESKISQMNWLCGGAIIHEQYILTSAACIEDARNFYVISGTHQWVPFSEKDNECVKNSAKRAIWKCVPKAYVFDGDEFDNIRWMVGDIAVVKVEDEFNFERRVHGCDFIPQKVAFNNQTPDYEKPKTLGSIAGWGSLESFSDMLGPPAVNSQELLETDVETISKAACKKRWDPRYHYIIDDSMICTRDHDDEQAMSAICAEREVNCQEMIYSNEVDESEEDEHKTRRMVLLPRELQVDTAAHIDLRKKGVRSPSGGFCENDHGGPLIVGHGKSSIIVGIMSACLTKKITNKCYGPYLYTSVYRYRNLISCAIDKELGFEEIDNSTETPVSGREPSYIRYLKTKVVKRPTCKKLLRSSKPMAIETLFDWSRHPDGFSSRPIKRMLSNINDLTNIGNQNNDNDNQNNGNDGQNNTNDNENGNDTFIANNTLIRVITLDNNSSSIKK